MSSDSAKKRAGIGLQCLPTAPKLLIDTAAISVHRRFRAASSHANLSMLHHFGANARVRPVVGSFVGSKADLHW
jgi:hypothetical protein